MEKPSILMLSTDPRVLGGITNFTTTLMAYAARYQFTLVPLGSITDQAGGGVREGVCARFKRLWRMPRVVAAQAAQFSVIHLNTPFNAKGLVRDGLILAALPLSARQKLLLYFHGWQDRTARLIRFSPPLRYLLLRALRGVGMILVLSPAFKEQLVALGVDANRIHLTRTMFDGRALKDAVPLGNHQRFKRRRVLFMSRFVREKGIDELLAAFESLAEDYPDTDFIFAGDGPEYRRLYEQAMQLPPGLRRRLEFPGYVGGAQKAALLAACDIFALPTYYPEGLPVALLEAMAAGKPLLTSAVGGIKYALSEPENGILLQEITVPSVTQALRRLLDDPAYCAETGAHNAREAWAKFDAAIVTAEIETYYDQLAQS